jgi:hypothetical protein
VAPALRWLSASSCDAAGLRTESRFAIPAAAESGRPPAGARLPQAFELRCADIHATGCEATLRAERLSDVVALACRHGALVHGFTPVWYSAERLAFIASVVTEPAGFDRFSRDGTVP